MRGILSAMVLVCIAAFAGLSILPGLPDRHHPTVLGGTHVILVPAGDDNGGGH